MKIRRIDDHSVVEDVEPCTYEPLCRVYMAKRYNEHDGTSTLYARSKWELVPEKRWVAADVEVYDKRHIVLRHDASALGHYELWLPAAPSHLRVTNLGGGVVKFEECIS